MQPASQNEEGIRGEEDIGDWRTSCESSSEEQKVWCNCCTWSALGCIGHPEKCGDRIGSGAAWDFGDHEDVPRHPLQL